MLECDNQEEVGFYFFFFLWNHVEMWGFFVILTNLNLQIK